MTIRLAIAPDSWGVWFPSHDRQTPWGRCLSEMAQAGYEGVELGPWGYFPTHYEELQAALTENSLELVAGTIGANFLEDASVDDMLSGIDDIAALLTRFEQARFIVLLPSMYTDLETGVDVMARELTEAQWATYVANVQRASDHCAKHGLIGAFHPHVDCHVQTEAQIERLLADSTVQLCLDIGHHVYGGGEPIAFYLRHADRIPYLHIKDCDNSVKAKMDREGWSFSKAVQEGIMTVPGLGTIDLAQLHAALIERGFEGWVTEEQDLFPVTSFDDPLPLATQAYQNLRKAGF